ncbi:hypothetical protein D3C80_1285770 [compost metagenome]
MAQVLDALLVDVQAQVALGGGEHLVGVVEQAHSAAGKLRHHLRIKQHRPAVGRRLGQARRQSLLLVTEAGGAPGIGAGIAIARVVHRHVLAELLADAGQVRQAGFVQRLQGAAADRPRQVLAGGQHQVVAAAPGQQFGLHGFQRVEVVGHHADTGAFFEVAQGIRGQVLAPDVQVDRRLLIAGSQRLRHTARQRYGQATGAQAHEIFAPAYCGMVMQATLPPPSRISRELSIPMMRWPGNNSARVAWATWSLRSPNSGTTIAELPA